MGAETSKPVEPPTDWEARANKFQIISPVSDISNPSDIRKFFSTPTPAPAQSHDRRRASRTVTKALPRKTKEVPQPSAFYFPTKESEKYAESLSRRKSQQVSKKITTTRLEKTKRTLMKAKETLTGCFDSENAKFEEGLEELELSPRNGFRREQTKGCFDIGGNMQIDKNRENGRVCGTNPNEISRMSIRNEKGTDRNDDYPSRTEYQGKKSTALGVGSNPEKLIRRETTSNSSVPEVRAGQHQFVLRETADLMIPEAYKLSIPTTKTAVVHEPTPIHESEQAKAAELALHQEDAYFDRLIGGGRGGVGYATESPCVLAEYQTSRILPQTLCDVDSPVSNLFVSEYSKSLPDGKQKPTRKSLKSYPILGSGSKDFKETEKVSDAPVPLAAPTVSEIISEKLQMQDSSAEGSSSTVSSLLLFQAKYRSYSLPGSCLQSIRLRS